jgi:beta-phosphoglucomutase
MNKTSPIKAILFDLDGVLVSTDKFHYQAWKKVADEEGIPFDYKKNDRLRGIGRMECLEILLEDSSRKYYPEDKDAIANQKNGYFKELIKKLTPNDYLPGALEFVKDVTKEGFLLAVCSSSKNAREILTHLDGTDLFKVIVDGYAITKTKPDPQIFLLGAKNLGVMPSECLVFEDAEVGVEAAQKAGMFCIGVGCKKRLSNAKVVIKGFDEIGAIRNYIAQW